MFRNKPRLMYDNVLKGSTGTSIMTFNMIDTKNQVVFDAYCADSNIGATGGYAYARMNLEDSQYGAATAEKLRSVVKNGFWDSGDEVALGAAAGVDNLTQGEAMVATQLAIWEVIHGEKINVVSFVNSMTNSESSWNGYRPENKGDISPENYDSCYAEVVSGYASMDNVGTIRANIEKTYNYLLSLAPIAPQEAAVSSDAFKEWEISECTENTDGTYNITVNVPKELAFKEITLAIDGVQTVSDVFLFDAKGAREVSQTFVAECDSQLPVHAEIKAVEERIIKINKTNKGSGIALEGIQFDVYYAGSIKDYFKGKLLRPCPRLT